MQEEVLGKSRGRVDDMLAVVENQEDALVLQERLQTRKRLVRVNRYPEGRSDRRSDEGRIRHRPELDETDRAAEIVEQRMSDVDGDRRLADASSANDGQEPVLHQLGGERPDSLLASRHPREPGPQAVRELPGSRACRRGTRADR
jgi:hypothetical protein